MFCDACGTQLDEGQNFCRACGKPVGAPVTPAAPVAARPPAPRVAANLRVLAILWIARGVLWILPAIFLMSLSHMQFPSDVPPEAQTFLHPFLNAIGWLLLLGGIASFVAAWGLMERSPWARLYAIILGAINLIEVPLGTALGIYTLWVLLPEKSEEEYRELAARA